MGKPISERGKLIREALRASPDAGNAEVAKALAEAHPDLEFTAAAVASQRQALRKGGDAAPAPPGSGLTPADLEAVKALADKAGGLDGLIRWLELLRDFR